MRANGRVWIFQFSSSAAWLNELLEQTINLKGLNSALCVADIVNYRPMAPTHKNHSIRSSTLPETQTDMKIDRVSFLWWHACTCSWLFMRKRGSHHLPGLISWMSCCAVRQSWSSNSSVSWDAEGKSWFIVVGLWCVCMYSERNAGQRKTPIDWRTLSWSRTVLSDDDRVSKNKIQTKKWRVLVGCRRQADSLDYYCPGPRARAIATELEHNHHRKYLVSKYLH